MRNVFVTGTDTDIGKTVLAGILACGLQADYWKPVQSGSMSPTDSERIASWLGEDRVHRETYLLKEPLSPNQSAEQEGKEIVLEDFSLPLSSRPVVVEGAGGLLVPLNQQHTMLDLIIHLGLPVIVAARSGLGTINHSLLSLLALKRARVPILGVVFIGPESSLNSRDVGHFSGVPVLGYIPWMNELEVGRFPEIFHSWSLPEDFV